MLKAFKYFDLNNDGTCQPEEFAKALEKVGVQINSKKDLTSLFSYYDSDSSGALDYKEFTAMLTGDKNGQAEEKMGKTQSYG